MKKMTNNNKDYDIVKHIQIFYKNETDGDAGPIRDFVLYLDDHNENAVKTNMTEAEYYKTVAVINSFAQVIFDNFDLVKKKEPINSMEMSHAYYQYLLDLKKEESDSNG